MKKIIYNCLIALLFVTIYSCDESILNEVPKSFLSPENAYVTKAQFDESINELHRYVRWMYFPEDGAIHTALNVGTDQAYNPESFNTGAWADMQLYKSGNWFYQRYWILYYRLISQANTVIARAESKNSKLTDSEKLSVIGQAKFFRAYGHKCLANLYGGVPIIDYEVVSPKRDYVKVLRQEVYEFCISDLEYARQNLTRIADGRGRISAGVADHLLAEVYVSAQQWDKAIEAASRLIDDPQYRLMNERFGKVVSRPGDVFNDLSRQGNVDRADGNFESIWTLQVTSGIEGGPTNPNNGVWEMLDPSCRRWGPRYWTLRDPAGKSGCIAVDSLGRGASWVKPTYHASTEVYLNSDWNDMRNSKYNIKRDFYYNDPTSAYFGQKVTQLYNAADTMMAFYPYLMKVWDWPAKTPFAFAQTNRPIRMMRLAETYLIRAEAYLGKGDKQNAAKDINVVRARANATPVSADKVDIDYILDERTRELIVEEFRMLTLTRLGKLYERAKKHNPATGRYIAEHHNLWAIPQTEIDLNTEAVLVQNPGYE